MSNKSQRKFSKQFKFNIVLESFVTGNAVATASRHGVHPTQLNNWRKILKTQGPELYEYRRSKVNSGQMQIARLEQLVGRMAMENEILKKTEELLI